MKSSNYGFTLIEVMIAVAVVAIIASIAFPAYRDQLEKGRRADGKALLTNMTQQLERCYTKFGRYNNAGCSVQNGDSINSEDAFYSVNVAGVAATTYSLTAVPQGVQAADTTCANLTIDQAGQQTYSGTGVVSQCW